MHYVVVVALAHDDGVGVDLLLRLEQVVDPPKALECE